MCSLALSGFDLWHSNAHAQVNAESAAGLDENHGPDGEQRDGKGAIDAGDAATAQEM